MANVLKDLMLEEVSLVDVPANPLASVPLFKRHTEMTDETNYEEVNKTLEAEKVELQKSVDALTQEVADLKKFKEDAEQAAIEKAQEFIEIEGEKIAKSDIPASVLKHLEAVTKEKETQEINKKAEELLPNLPGTIEQRAKLLKSINFDADLLTMLTAADKLFAGKFEEVGKGTNDGDMVDAEKKLEELAKAHAIANNKTYEQGYASVIKTAEGKALYKETLKK